MYAGWYGVGKSEQRIRAIAGINTKAEPQMSELRPPIGCD